MTAIDITTDIPPQINTLERLAMWSLMALRRVNPTLAITEVADSSPEKVVQTALAQTDDDNIRFIGRVSLKMDPTYVEDNSTKLWTKALELSNTQLPDAFKQD